MAIIKSSDFDVKEPPRQFPVVIIEFNQYQPKFEVRTTLITSKIRQLRGYLISEIQ